MTTRLIAASVGQQGSALANLVMAGIQLPDVGSKNDSTNPTGAGTPVAVEVGAVVLNGANGPYLHVPFCSSIYLNPQTGKFGRGGSNGAATHKVGFANRVLPFLAEIKPDQAGILRFYGDILGCDDPQIAFRLKAAAFLQVDQRLIDAGAYEGAGGTTDALRAFADSNYKSLKRDGLTVKDVDNVYGYANRLFALRAQPLLVPDDEDYEDRYMRAAGVADWMPAGVA